MGLRKNKKRKKSKNPDEVGTAWGRPTKIPYKTLGQLGTKWDYLRNLLGE
jgi:hypothetical protein